MIERLKEGWSVAMVGAACHQSETTVRKWWDRYRDEGIAGLQDRSCRPSDFGGRCREGVWFKSSGFVRSDLRVGDRADSAPAPLHRRRVLRRVGLSRLSLLEPPKTGAGSLPARACRRARPPRREALGQDRQDRPSHSRRSPTLGAGSWLRIRARRHR
jgi:hypothetical protein